MGLQSTLLLLFHFFRFCSSIDTISGNQSIKEGDLLVSSGQTFALGFFGPRNSSSQRYVGIWYHKISERTIVWVANRDNPINGTSGILSINKDGNLVLRDQNQCRTIPLWQTNLRTAQKTTNFSAQLLDSGNLVLVQGGDSGGSGSVVVAWQSFDYPTNTMLPGMKLGLDRRTGLDRFLTSWKSGDDPGTGESSYRMDPGGVPQLVLRKGRVKRWRSGPWVGHKWSGIPEMVTKNYIFDVRYIDSEEEISVAYSLINDSALSITILDEFGYVKRVNWDDSNSRWVEFWSVPKDRCDYYGRCVVFGNCDTNTATEFECTCLPGYGPSSAGDEPTGCARKSLLRCGKGDGFVNVSGVKIPDTSEARALTRLGVKECKEECLRNCSCSAYMSDEEGVGKCITWYGNLTDTREFTYGGLDLYVRVAAAESGEQSKKQRNFHGRMVSIVVPSIVVPLSTISLLCWLLLKRKKESNVQLRDEENQDLRIFDMVTITKATNKFSEINKIGEGGFGRVYKGQLLTGKEIAVKRLSINSMQGVHEFKNEVLLIAKLQHRNLVRLLGCCIHGEERMLIYEYMSNGSLDSFIFGEENKKGNLLTWRKRLDIIVGIARGLLYLHQDSRLRVIHRDLKASNVLLDCDMNPKISDFGLARVFGGDQSSAITRRVVGTYGYMSPEYVIDGIFSTKSDVFSFGVIILEILSGKKNRLFNHRSHDLNLLGHAWRLWMEGKASELLDPLLEDSCRPLSELIRFIQVGLLCVQKFQKNRPTMSSVLLMLITETAILPQPKEPGFYTERNPDDQRDYYPLPDSSSSNDMTVTQLEAR